MMFFSFPPKILLFYFLPCVVLGDVVVAVDAGDFEHGTMDRLAGKDFTPAIPRIHHRLHNNHHEKAARPSSSTLSWLIASDDWRLTVVC